MNLFRLNSGPGFMLQYVMAKSVQKAHARRLRQKGQSIKEIAKKIGVSVASVSIWCRDIELSSSQIKLLETRARDPFYGKRASYLNLVKTKKDSKIKRLGQEGIVDIGKLTKRELFLVGAALYWAEGFKKDKQAGFANSDPAMINLFLRWLNECFGYKTEDLLPRVTINISHSHRIKEVQDYWFQETGIPLETFGKPFYQNVKWKKVYENPNEYFGVLRIKVRKSIDFLRKIYGYIEGLRLQSKIR